MSPPETSALRVLHVNHVDAIGGAAIAARRLVGAQRRLGLASEMLVDRCVEDECWIHRPATAFGNLWAGQIRPALDRVPIRLVATNLTAPWGLNWVPTDTARRIAKVGPDVVNLHWISAGMLPPRDLPRIRAPIVWTLHDMWAFTGGCHFDRSCDRYAAGCGHCPQIGSRWWRDLSYFRARDKQAALAASRPVLVSPSRWLAAQARASSACSHLRVEVIPNGVDRSCFHPRPRSVCRELFGLPQETPLVLFGAIDAMNDPNKGGRHFIEALNALQARTSQGFLAVIFGTGTSLLPTRLAFPARAVGTVRDERAMAALLAAADVTVVPSEFENLPNVVLESLACGTPVVAFRVGGIPELVDHERNGWLAKPFDVQELATGIEWVLGRRLSTDRVSESVAGQFDIDVVARRYRDLYVEIRQGSPRAGRRN